MKKPIFYTTLLSLSALLIGFGWTAGAATPDAIDSVEIAAPADATAPDEATVSDEAAEEILVNGDAEPAIDLETGKAIDQNVGGRCNCRLNQPNNFCPAGTSCLACPCFTSAGSPINGVCG